MTLHDWVSLAMQAIIIVCLIAIIIDQHRKDQQK